ncbi:ATP-binding protein [Streptosporangiaceae bacterium NEAU-GS5]|nr:ATP-binding protein [Streptosporangiaceae bacterium NEAU-GS5]
MTRTDRLLAAHAIIVITAFFEALDAADLPIGSKDLDPGRPEDPGTADAVFDALSGLASTAVANPVPGRAIDWRVAFVQIGWSVPRQPMSHADQLDDLLVAYGLLARAVNSQAGLPHVGDGLRQVPEDAVRRYAEMYRRLSVDFPEFAFWAGLREHAATQEVLKTGLTGLARILADISPSRVPQEKLASLASANQAVLDHPISEIRDLPDGLTVPSHLHGYVNPAYRVVAYRRGTDLSSEQLWEQVEARDDLDGFLFAQLSSPDAGVTPLLVLGQPGAGKSLLTRILASHLARADFLPVRVPLRQVPADVGIQRQIEEAFHVLTGEQISWPDLARSGTGALPVVMLDGLDELLQATGVHRADYLAQVTEFQQREAELGRPVAVIVTTRTAVADRCAPPENAVVVRLEPFSDDHVAMWAKAWNDANSGYYWVRGFGPFTAQKALAHPELARQPLLLLMLALYDADANALSSGPEGLNSAQLYGQLLTRFALREIEKNGRNLPDDQQERLAHEELVRLSIASFAMFNRSRQWVTENDLDADLKALVGCPPSSSEGLAEPLSEAAKVIGRFFFVHQTEAVWGERRLKTYEFLHATFGEYLIAWLIRGMLQDMAIRRATPAGTFGDAPPWEDGRLRSLLSCAVLSMRGPILAFFRAMSADGMQETLIQLFRARAGRAGLMEYPPLNDVPVVRCEATYAANLLLLISTTDLEVDGARIFGSADPVPEWQRLARLCHAALRDEEWRSLIETVRPRRDWDEGRRKLTIVTDLFSPPDPDLAWVMNIPHGWPAWTSKEKLRPMLMEAGFFGDELHENLLDLYSASSRLPEFEETMFVRTLDGGARSVLAVALALYVESAKGLRWELLVEYYRAALHTLNAVGGIDAQFEGSHSMVLDALARDAMQLPVDLVTLLLRTILARASDFPNQIDLMVGCALDLVARGGCELDLLDQCLRDPSASLSHHTALRVMVTLIELGISPGEVPSTAFVKVWRLSRREFAEIEAEDPLLCRRARRISPAERVEYGLTWPE